MPLQEPVAARDAPLVDAMGHGQLDLCDVTSHCARHGDAVETAEDRDSGLARHNDDRSDDGSKIDVPDIAARDHARASPARAAAASSVLASSSLRGALAYAAR
jgi:hypothetical protein